jgi:hypothetical protein
MYVYNTYYYLKFRLYSSSRGGPCDNNNGFSGNDMGK